jgi:hypothetical protein
MGLLATSQYHFAFSRVRVVFKYSFSILIIVWILVTFNRKIVYLAS